MPLFFNMVSSVFLQYWFCLPVISESRHRHFVPVTLPRLQTIGLEFYQNSLACMCRKYSIGLRTGHSIFLLLHRADETQPAQYSCPTLILAFTSSKDQGKTLSSPCKCFPKIFLLKLFLDMAPSSSSDVTHTMRAQNTPLPRNHLTRNGGNVIYVLIFKRSFIEDILSALLAVVLVGWAFLWFFLLWLFIILPFIWFEGV